VIRWPASESSDTTVWLDIRVCPGEFRQRRGGAQIPTLPGRCYLDICPLKSKLDLSRNRRFVSHPYAAFENTPLWESIAAAIAELRENRDIELSTAPDYVIGYLCKRLAEEQVVLGASLKHAV